MSSFKPLWMSGYWQSTGKGVNLMDKMKTVEIPKKMPLKYANLILPSIEGYYDELNRFAETPSPWFIV